MIYTSKNKFITFFKEYKSQKLKQKLQQLHASFLSYYNIAMQANCLVFPSPKTHTIGQIQDKIILIPQNSSENRHLLYSSFCSSDSFKQKDEFRAFLHELDVKPMTHTQQVKKENALTEAADKQTEMAHLQGNLNLVQKVHSKQYIPCLFLKGTKDKLMVFFHANGEDISSAYEFLKMVNLQTNYPILAMEYRGYSIYDGQTSPKNIEADAARIMEFLQANKLTSNQIMLFGRSIGCAVALTVTQKYSIYCAILLSPFISLKKIAKDLYCGCAGSLLKQAFDNQQNCKKIQCPLLIIHGAKDTLVPFEHSLKLMSGCQAYCRLKIVENMTHTKFNFRLDFIQHLKRFLFDLQK